MEAHSSYVPAHNCKKNHDMEALNKYTIKCNLCMCVCAHVCMCVLRRRKIGIKKSEHKTRKRERRRHSSIVWMRSEGVRDKRQQQQHTNIKHSVKHREA